MPALDPATRLVQNPEVVRLPVSGRTVCVRDEVDRLLPLSDAICALLARFKSPALLGEALPGAPERELRAISELVALRLLLVEGDLPRTTSVCRRPAAVAFANAPRWDGDRESPGALVILGARFDGGTLPAYPRGSARGPDLIRSASSALGLRLDLWSGEALGLHDVDEGRPILAGARLRDAGDLDPAPAATYAEVAARLEEEIRGLRRQGARVILLGGDHSLTWPAVRALDEPAFGVLHLDAHTDLAPLRFPGDVHHGNVLRHVCALPGVAHVVQLGHRGINQAAPVLPGVDYTSYPVERLRRLDAAARGALCRPDLPYYLSVDVDGLDPSVAPGTPAPTPDGFGLAEARALLREVTRGRRLLGADVVEVLPDADRPAITGLSAAQLVLEILSIMEEGR
jgi:agmatinase